MTPVFVKHYTTAENASRALQAYRWFASMNVLTVPQLLEWSPTSMTYEFVVGRHASIEDLNALARQLGQLSAHVRSAELSGRQNLEAAVIGRSLRLEDFAVSKDAWIAKHGAELSNSEQASFQRVLSVTRQADLYKDANLRNFLITASGLTVTLDYDSLTVAPTGYDLAKLIVSLYMAGYDVGKDEMTSALDAFNADGSAGVLPADLSDYLAVNGALTRRYVGANGYVRSWPRGDR